VCLWVCGLEEALLSGSPTVFARQKLFKYTRLERLEDLVAGLFAPLGVESASVAEALYRVIAEDVVSPKDLPEFSVSHVDGFAVSECDSKVFKVVSSEVLNWCEAALVETGHPVPEGAVAVVPVESVRFLESNEIVVPRSYERFHEIIRKGSDLSRGEAVCRKGWILTPPLARALLELGIEEVKVYRRPRVLVVPIGSEFTEGVKRESSSVLVKAMCQAVGASVEVSKPVEDSVEAVKVAAERGVDMYDVVVTIGGASLGSKDFTLTALLELPDSALIVRGLAIQPGRVTSLVTVKNKPVVLLPGLVQSTVVGAIFLLQPLIKRLQGARPRAHYPIGLYRLASDYSYSGRFTSFKRLRFVKLVSEELLEVEVVETPSPVQKAIVASHGFIMLESGVSSLSRGSYVTVYRAPGLYAEGLLTS